MPDPSDTVAMLHWLRARIPQHLLDEYREPFQARVRGFRRGRGGLLGLTRP